MKISKYLKRAISLIVSIMLVANMLVFVNAGITASALTPEEIEAKNYPIPSGYSVSTVLQTYDTYAPGTTNLSTHSISTSTDPDSFYDGASMKFVAYQANREVGLMTSSQKLDGDGYMFWYKSANSTTFRVRTSSNSIINYGVLPASTGTWVTIYYYGKTSNFTYNTSSVQTNYRSRIKSGETVRLFFMSNSSTYTAYIDELITFKADTTAADTYTSDSDFFKFSLANMSKESKTVAAYNAATGGVNLTSTLGATASQYPIDITYDVNANAVEDAIAKANGVGGSGFLEVSLSVNSCLNSGGTANQWLKFILSIADAGVQLIRHNIEVGTTQTYLIDVSNVTDPSSINSVNIAIQGASSSLTIKDVNVDISKITVHEFEAGTTLYQAEDSSPKIRKSAGSAVEDAPIFSGADTNNRYAYIPTSLGIGGYLELDLGAVPVGVYEVKARTLDNSTRSTVWMSANNLNPVKNISTKNTTYTTYSRDTYSTLGQVTITKETNTKIKFTLMALGSSSIYIDYLVLKKVDDAIAEPLSNFEIKAYPEMTNYEVLNVLSRWDDFIVGTDNRYFENQVYGYVGDGNAFNLNSRKTVGKTYFDNNSLVNYITMGGNGIRFWYKSNGAGTLQFCTSNTVIYSYNLVSNPSGGWKTIYYTDLVANGDLSNITRICLKTGGQASTYYYIDEMHTIQLKLGEITYSVANGEATVTGYTLRVEDAIIPSTFNGYPVVAIADGAFKNNKNLKSVCIPDSVKTIGSEAFSGCLNLSDLDLGEGVETLGANAFYNNPKLFDVNAPDSLTDIDSTAFASCANLRLIVDSASYAKTFALSNGVKFQSVDCCGYVYNNNVSSVSIVGYESTGGILAIPSTIDGVNVTSIGENAFKNNVTISGITLPNTVTSVGNSAFENNYNMTSFTMSNATGSQIGNKAFANNDKLENVTLGTGVTTIGNEAFLNNIELEALYLPDQVTSIGTDSFKGCSNLVVSMTLTPSNYVYTYANTNSLKYIPTTTSDYKYFVINYKATVMSYTGTATAISIPGTIDGYTVVAVGKNAFANNTTITTLSFADSVKLIDNSAFYLCTSLVDIDFGEIRKINALAFYGCIGLTELTMVDLVECSVYAFEGCTNLDLTIEETQFQRSALDYVKGMTVGWNLGNTLDSWNAAYSYGQLTVAGSEQLWGAPITTQAMIDKVADSGFNTIRIPVTWQAFIDDNGVIDAAYMARVKQVVDYAYNKNMYVVLNLHHDRWMNLATTDFPGMKAKLANFWTQLGNAFKFYDEKLILEGFNEVRYNEDWYGQTDEILSNYNELNQVFYNTVRATGGLNDRRYLMIETYAAQFGNRQLNPFWYPTAAQDDHVIVSVHMYNNSMSASTYTYNLDNLYNKFVAQGIPCIIGETGIPSAWTSDENAAAWATLFLNLCEERDLKVIFWDDHGNYEMLLRNSLTWKQPLYIQAIYDATRPVVE